MLGVELESNQSERIIELGINERILLNLVKGNIIRLLPALNITFEEISELVKRLEKVLKNI
jgi:acetylornithine/N-succinyldiaminopimelate aminotransferase